MSDPSNVDAADPGGPPEPPASGVTPPPPAGVVPPSPDTVAWPVPPGGVAPPATAPSPPVAPTAPPPSPVWGAPAPASPPTWGPAPSAPPGTVQGPPAGWLPPASAGAPSWAPPAAPPGPPPGIPPGLPPAGPTPGAPFPPLGGDPYAAPAGPPRDGGGRTALVVLAIVVVAVVLAGTVAAVAVRRSTDAAAGPSSTPTTTSTAAPSTTSRPSTTSTTAAPTTAPSTGGLDPQVVQNEVANLSTFVEDTWGKPFKTPVKVEVLDDTAFTDRLLGKLDEEKDKITKQEGAFKALGILPAGGSLYDVSRTLYSGGVLGYYDPETKELVVRGGDITPYVRQTIVHELTHALQDQYANLDRKEYDDRKDEVSFGLDTLAEGDARRVEKVYENQLSAADKRDRDREEAAFGADMDLSSVPDFLKGSISAPYDLGEPFVDGIVAGGGNEALLQAFADPPTTSEEVLQPAKYRAREGRVDVARPPVDGEVVDEGVFGAVPTALLLGDAVSSRTALQAADGWKGDWYVTYRQPDGDTCVRIDYVMDTATDGQQLRTALSQWSAQLPSSVQADVQQQGSGNLRLTSCTRGA
ncbi:MAG: hypothetical protein R2726_14015 [Acidimicrobiales bacterium]